MGLREYRVALKRMLELSNLTWAESEKLLQVFASLHGELQRLVVDSGMYRPAEAARLRDSMESILLEHGNGLLRAGQEAQLRAWMNGVEAFDELMASVELNYVRGLSGLEDRMVQEYLTINRIAGVTEEMKALIRSEVLGGVFMEKTPYQVMSNISNLIGIKDLPGYRSIGTTGISAKAERIMRTETMAIQNSAKWWNEQETRQRMPDLQRVWVATGDARTRLDHLAAHGQVRAAGEPFSVGGEQARFPGDPNLSPAQRVNCRCTVVPYRAEWGEVDSLIGPLSKAVAREMGRREG